MYKLRKIITSIWFIGLSTLIVFPLLAWPIFYFTETNFAAIFYCKQEYVKYVPIFLSSGIIVGLIIIYLTDLPFFEKPLSRYRNMLQDLRITIFQAIFLSICAGVGEEIFFRGAIQPFLGIWLTSIIFVAIHGYYSYKNWPVTVFGLSLTLFIAFIGWAASELSLWHAIAAHFSYDFVLLMYHRHTNKV